MSSWNYVSMRSSIKYTQPTRKTVDTSNRSYASSGKQRDQHFPDLAKVRYEAMESAREDQ